MNRTFLLAFPLIFTLTCQGALAAGLNTEVTGSTLFPPLTDAGVTVRVGTTQYSATADATGNYSLEIAAPGADDLISLEIQGTGSQSHFRYARLVGQWSDLESETTGTGPVDLGPASPLSTVFYVLVEARSGGSLPAAFFNVAPLVRTMPTGDLYSMMFVLAAVEQDMVDVGAGIDNTLDMLRDPQAVLAVTDEIADTRESWDQAQEALIQQFDEPRLYRPRGAFPDRLESIPADLSWSPRTLLEFGNDTQAWLGQRGYGGAITRDTGLRDRIWSDRFSLGGLEHREWVFRSAPGAEVVYRTGQTRIEPGADLIPYREVLYRLTWRTLDASTSFYLAGTKIDLTRLYPDNPELPPEAVIWDITHDIVSEVRHEHLPATWQGPQAGSTWALPLCAYDFDHRGSPAYQGAFGYDFVTFNGDGTASTRRTQFNNLQWSLQDGLLTLTADNMPEVRLRYVGNTTHDALVAATCRKPSGEPRAMSGRASPIQPVMDFDQLDLPIRFVSGSGFDTYLPPFLTAPEFGLFVEYWTIELYADGTGKAGSVFDPFNTSQSPNTYTLEWTQLANGRVEIHKEHTAYGEAWGQSRSWLPIAIEGDDMLFIESLFLGPRDELNGELEQPGRNNWYRMIPLP